MKEQLLYPCVSENLLFYFPKMTTFKLLIRYTYSMYAVICMTMKPASEVGIRWVMYNECEEM